MFSWLLINYGIIIASVTVVWAALSLLSCKRENLHLSAPSVLHTSPNIQHSCVRGVRRGSRDDETAPWLCAFQRAPTPPPHPFLPPPLRFPSWCGEKMKRRNQMRRGVLTPLCDADTSDGFVGWLWMHWGTSACELSAKWIYIFSSF